jgi:hypothetical protein
MSQRSGLSRILEIGMSFRAAKTLLTAVECDPFTKLGRESMDAEKIRETLALHPRGIRDFLDAVVALGLLEREIDDPENPDVFRELTVQ